MKRSILFMIVTLALLLAIGVGGTALAGDKCCAKDGKGACLQGSGKTCTMDSCKNKAQCADLCAKNGCKDKGQCTDACKSACSAKQGSGSATAPGKATCANKSNGACKPGECKQMTGKPAPSK